MFTRPLFFAFVLAALSFAGCRKAEITSYRVPKEKAAPAAPAGPTADTNSAPNSSAAATPGMANTPVSTADGPGLTWTAPVTWTLKPAAAMRKATYSVPGAGGAAELSITAFPSDVGGEAANLNRWRGQVQLPALAETELAKSVTRLTANGLAIAVADFSNPQAPASAAQHIVGAIVPFEGSTWFFKLSGADAVVADAKPAFLEFLKSVKSATPAAP